MRHHPLEFRFMCYRAKVLCRNSRGLIRIICVFDPIRIQARYLITCLVVTVLDVEVFSNIWLWLDPSLFSSKNKTRVFICVHIDGIHTVYHPCVFYWFMMFLAKQDGEFGLSTTVIFQQLLDGSPWYFVQTFLVSCTQMTLVTLLTFTLVSPSRWWLWNFLQIFKVDEW